MADQPIVKQEIPDARFKSVLIYVNWTSAAILIIVLCVFFVPIPINNQKYVDIGIGILLGILSSNSGTITGTPITPTKKADTAITGDNAIVNNPPATDQPTNTLQ